MTFIVLYIWVFNSRSLVFSLFLCWFLSGGGVFDTWLYTMARFDTDRLSRGVGSEKLIEIGSSI